MGFDHSPLDYHIIIPTLLAPEPKPFNYLIKIEENGWFLWLAEVCPNGPCFSIIPCHPRLSETVPRFVNSLVCSTAKLPCWGIFGAGGFNLSGRQSEHIVSTSWAASPPRQKSGRARLQWKLLLLSFRHILARQSLFRLCFLLSSCLGSQEKLFLPFALTGFTPLLRLCKIIAHPV